MAKALPLVFVGSSSEKSEVADVIAKHLANIADVHSWKYSDSFKPTSSTLAGLLHAAQRYHFGIFVLTPDDKTTSRGTTEFSTRDNVLFEFGLFLGALGPERNMAIMEKSKNKLKIPSDLLGIHIEPFSYTNRDNLLSQINAVLDRYRETIKRLGRKSPFSLQGPYGFDKGRFFFEITEMRLTENREKIGDQKLLLVVRKHNPEVSDEEDTKIQKSVVRAIGKNEQHIKLTAKIEPRKGDQIKGYLFLVPEKSSISTCRNMKALEEAGCLLLDVCGIEI
jgi:hypothetical protein